MEHAGIFLELLAVLGPAAIMSLILAKFKQPALVGYLLTGLVLGMFHIEVNNGVSEFLSELGILSLLFVAGLHIDPREILKASRPTAILVISQMLFFGPVGFFLGYTLHMTLVGGFLLSLALWLSSTIVVVGILDKLGEADEPHGRAMMIIMVIQDVIALTTIALIPIWATGGNTIHLIQGIGLTLLKAAAILGFTFFSGKYIFPKVFPIVENDQEQQLVLPMAWAFGHMWVAHLIGFSMETAVFFSGISLSMLGYSYIVAGKIRSFVHFGLVFFFVSVGAKINLSLDLFSWQLFAVFIIIIVGTPFVTLPAAVLAGLGKRSAFVLGFIPAQISEFSLILLTLAVEAGLIDESILVMMTIATVITMATSIIIGTRSSELYYKFRDSKLFDWLEKNEVRVLNSTVGHDWDAIMYGADSDFFTIVMHLEKLGLKVLMIDADRERLRYARKLGFNATKADYLDPEIVQVFLPKRILISTSLRSKQADLWTIKCLTQLSKKVITIAIQGDNDVSKELEAAGWSIVISPKSEIKSRIHHEIDKRSKELVF